MKATQILFSTLLALSILIIGYWTERTNSVQLIGCFVLAFGAYGYLSSRKGRPDLQSLSDLENLTGEEKTRKTLKPFEVYIILGIGIRFLLLFAIPNLSDDFYRFIWDGRLLNNGINPFLELPSFYIENGLYSDFLIPDLYQNLNSQQYFTVYPPVLQAIFMLATWLFPNSILGSVMVMKAVLLLFEIGSIILILKLLRHFKMPEQNVILYALNPVVILEIVGSIHFEGTMIFFSLLAIWLLVKNKWWWSAASMGMAIVAKLLPLMFLPFLIKRLKWKSIRYYFVLEIVVLLLFSPLLNKVFITNISESIGLYFQDFEYNGSFYYVLRWIGFQIEGYNMISYLSPWLSLAVAISIFGLSLNVKETTFKQLPRNMLFALTIFYLLSTTVHPWYITSMVAFGTLTRFRYPMVWSGLIFLTYFNYGYEPFQENIWLVIFEYLILLSWIIWEIKWFSFSKSK